MLRYAFHRTDRILKTGINCLLSEFRLQKELYNLHTSTKPAWKYRGGFISRAYASVQSAGTVPKNVLVHGDGDKVEVTWCDGDKSRFHAIWLRHNCTCEKCYSFTLNQPLIQIDKLPLDVRVQSASLKDNDKLHITWEDKLHHSEFDADFLRKYRYSGKHMLQKKDSVKPKLYKQPSIPSVTWEQISNDDIYVYKWLKDISEHGLALITGAPVQEGFLLEFLPKKVGPLLENTYGKMYDVVASENPTNLAYTGSVLQFHMDLVYYESTPGVQFLNCLKFDDSIVGGETMFVDMFAICEEFRKSNPDEFETLCKVPCTFSRIHTARDHPAHLVMRRPIINLNKEGEIIGVFWNPAVVGPLEVHEQDVVAFCRAYQLFARGIANFHTKNEVRLRPGDIVGFNNRRMAHGRNAFQTSKGSRHFQGAYISISDYTSRLNLLKEHYGDRSPIRRVGNMDWM